MVGPSFLAPSLDTALLCLNGRLTGRKGRPCSPSLWLPGMAAHGGHRKATARLMMSLSLLVVVALLSWPHQASAAVVSARAPDSMEDEGASPSDHHRRRQERHQRQAAAADEGRVDASKLFAHIKSARQLGEEGGEQREDQTADKAEAFETGGPAAPVGGLPKAEGSRLYFPRRDTIPRLVKPFGAVLATSIVAMIRDFTGLSDQQVFYPSFTSHLEGRRKATLAKLRIVGRSH